MVKAESREQVTVNREKGAESNNNFVHCSLLTAHCSLFIVLCSLFTVNCSQSIPSRSESVLGTICTITLYEHGKSKVYDEIFSRLEEIENRMSVRITGSEVDNINASAGIVPVKVSADVFLVIETALYYAGLSNGAFDPTVGPLVSLWDIGGDNPRIPAQEEIDEILPLVNWRDVQLDRQNSTIFLKNAGMALDLGAIAKGYAADEAAAIIRKAKIPRAIIDLGGNILIVGEKKDKSLWNIGIQDPLDSRGASVGIIKTTEKTIVTSGIYERFFWADDIIYHHLLSPSNGYPASNGLMSVTIITDCSMNADALSTAVFVLGYEKGAALVESLDGVDAVFIFDDCSIRVTDGIEFSLSNDDYEVIK